MNEKNSSDTDLNNEKRSKWLRLGIIKVVLGIINGFFILFCFVMILCSCDKNVDTYKNASDTTQIPVVSTMLTEERENNEATKEVPLNTVLLDFCGYIEKYCVESELAENSISYGLAFIDADQVPELLLVDSNEQGNYVKIVFYNGGNHKEIEQFQSDGIFSYIKYENCIVSSIKSDSVCTTNIIHINHEFSAIVDYVFEKTDDGIYKIDGKEVSNTVYEEKLAEITSGKQGNKLLTNDFNNLMRCYSYSNKEFIRLYLIEMYKNLENPDFEDFYKYYNDNMYKISDEWSLVECKAETAVKNFTYSVKDNIDDNESYKVNSEVSVSKQFGVSIWINTFTDNELFKFRCIKGEKIPMLYFGAPVSLNGKEYGWSTVLYPDSNEFEWYVTFMYDEETDHLIAQVLWPKPGESHGDYPIRRNEKEVPIADSLVLTYERKC